MRTTKDLIAELDTEGIRHALVAIVVAFESSTLPIYSGDENRQQLLDDAVEVGGSPIGLIAFDRSAKGSTIATCVFPSTSQKKRHRRILVYERFLKRLCKTWRPRGAPSN